MTAPTADELAQMQADMEHEHAVTDRLIEKGFTPHSKGPIGGMIGAIQGAAEETWWERPSTPEVNFWPYVVTVIALLIFILLLFKGWPL